MGTYVGLDLGTSGVRAVAIDDMGKVCAKAARPLPPSRRCGSRVAQRPADWWEGVVGVLEVLLEQITPGEVRSIAVDGTSGTLLLTDADGRPLTEALMYDDARADAQLRRIKRVAPARSAAAGGGSALARMLHLQSECPAARHALHQADWIAGCLMQRFGISDENNALKLGYDPVSRGWPQWISLLDVPERLLPAVVPPGEAIGHVASGLARDLGLAPDARVIAGTTDSVAAFLGTGAGQAGDAVTSLGSTLVVKMLCERPVFAPEFSVYSHRLGDVWLVGGASNTGGAALLEFFDVETLRRLSNRLDPGRTTGLDYYPLVGVGERFPINDPTMRSRTSPRPADDTVFLQGLLEGIARIEASAYRLLESLGAPSPKLVRTVGGGADNEAWTQIRTRFLGVPAASSEGAGAAYGAALLARRGVLNG